ncbi:MAG: glycerate kinase, partial [Bacteroidetes bacterium]|nr:glycerate kinase [Bacteroidota bacterium]
DLVITGEGKIDQQSIYGKGSFELIKLAQSYHKPVIVICGKVDLSIEELKKYGVALAEELISDTITTDESMKNAGLLLQKVSCNALKEYLT